MPELIDTVMRLFRVVNISKYYEPKQDQTYCPSLKGGVVLSRNWSILDGHMNISLWQLLLDFVGMPKISGRLAKLMPTQEKHTRDSYDGSQFPHKSNNIWTMLFHLFLRSIWYFRTVLRYQYVRPKRLYNHHRFAKFPYSHLHLLSTLAECEAYRMHFPHNTDQPLPLKKLV